MADMYNIYVNQLLMQWYGNLQVLNFMIMVAVMQTIKCIIFHVSHLSYLKLMKCTIPNDL